MKLNFTGSFRKAIITKMIILMLLLIVSTVSFSQEPVANQKWYGQFGFGAGSQKSITGSARLQVVWKKNWVTSLTFQSADMEPKTMPSDYYPGYAFFIPEPMPRVNHNMYSLTAGRLIEVNKNFWFTTEAGVAIVRGEKMTFTKQDPTNIIIVGTSNYNTETEKVNATGAVLKADATWAFLNWMGAGAGVYANFNSIQSPVGFELKIVFGKMNRK